MRALLRHVSDAERPLIQLFDEQWDPAGCGSLLAKIENAVYSHPSLLDDYATDVVIETSRVTWVPDSLLSSGRLNEETVYQAVYPGASSDVLTDRVGEATALYEFIPDFGSFMARTLPGARLRPHIAVLVEKFLAAPRDPDTLCIYADMRAGEIDLVAVKNESLVSASVQPWQSAEDAAYRIFHLINAYSSGGADCRVSVNCSDQALVSQVLGFTRGFCREAAVMKLPERMAACGLPLAAAMLMCKVPDREV